MDLASIAPATRTVPLGRGTVEITGLSLRKLNQLLVQFPALLSLGSGKIDLAALLLEAPEASLAVFSIAIAPSQFRFWQFWKWFPGDVAPFKSFDAAAAGQQLEILFDIFALTFEGERARPFLETLAKTITERDASLPISANTAPESSNS
jgi:hypothetical protein